MATLDDKHGRTPRYGEANMVAAITRLEQQVSFNYNNIQGLHQELKQVNEHVGRLQRDDLRLGRILPRAMDQGLCDPTDVEVLATKLANITTKVNWVDKLETELQLTKQRLKRLETQIAIDAPGLLLSGAVSHAEQQHYEAMRAQQKKQKAPSHPVPAMSPCVALHFEHGHTPAGVLESRPTPSFHPGQERHLGAHEQVQQGSRQPGIRAVELHVPPPPNAAAALRDWRAAESYPPSGRPTPPSHNDPLRSHPPTPESHAGGWTAVNISQVSKRPLGEHQPQRGSDQHGSPKRPKLTTFRPLKPRPSFDDAYHQCPYAQQAQMNPARQTRGGVPSGENPIQPHTHPAPDQEATNSHRFVTSTGQPDSQETRRETNGDLNIDILSERSTTGATDRGERRGGRGRGRGGRGRLGPTNISPPASETQEHVHKQILLQRGQYHFAPAHQATTNGHYLKQHTHSRVDAARPSPADPCVNTEMPPHSRTYSAGQEHESGATPVASTIHPYGIANDINPMNRKTRKKHIRNADGFLIRKDGRPDMRSVSSANNLRNSHRKDAAVGKDLTQHEPSGRRVASEPLPGKAFS